MPVDYVWVLAEDCGGEQIGFDLYRTREAALAAAEAWALAQSATPEPVDRWLYAPDSGLRLYRKELL